MLKAKSKIYAILFLIPIPKINVTFILGVTEGENEHSEPGHLKSGGGGFKKVKKSKNM